MVLDMYLYAEKYVGGWQHRKDAGFDEIVKAIGIRPDDGCPSFTVRAGVGYWRKANAIHRWFVQTVQNGEDDCDYYRVDREQLEQLRELCRSALDAAGEKEGTVRDGHTLHADGHTTIHQHVGIVAANPEAAAAILPTQGGFFFGGTDYDEGYLNDLRETIEIIDRVLDDKSLDDCDFYYHSSW